MAFYIPLIIVVVSNTFYHIISKSTPETANTFLSLSVTYIIAAIFTFILYFITTKQGAMTLATNIKTLNWTSFALGIAIVGLEAGYLLMYKVGWQVNSGQLVQSAICAIVLIFVGLFLFRETINVQKVIGIVVVMAGLFLINKK